MSDRDVFPADVARNLQQQPVEAQELRRWLEMHDDHARNHDRDCGLYRPEVFKAARALLAYVENEPARLAGVWAAGFEAANPLEYQRNTTPNPYRSGGQTNGN